MQEGDTPDGGIVAVGEDLPDGGEKQFRSAAIHSDGGGRPGSLVAPALRVGAAGVWWGKGPGRVRGG